MATESAASPIIFSYDNKSYGATTPSDSPTIVYCLHGRLSKNCCNEQILELTQIEKHCHTDIERSEGMDVHARKKLIIASILCLVFMMLEVVGGIYSNSLAIATDAAHLLTDFASFMISLFAIWFAGRPSTRKMSFGWYRAEVLGAIVSVLMIWVITAILVYWAILRCITRDFEVDAPIMLITSAVAIFVNIVMGWQLHGTHGHSHGGGSGGGHGHTENINVRAAFIHVLGDVLQSIGVFFAAIIIYFKPTWQLADPICTFIFSVIVLWTTITILKDAILVLMEATPTFLDYTDIMGIFMQVNGVVRVHNLRLWSLSINKNALSAHLAIAPEADPEDVLKRANAAIQKKYEFFETTLQIERFQQDMDDCKQCVGPLK
ncbi:proton-coupled zinc antiporter SLC30A2 isoform X1 [Sitodiplosis mosellana]|uniref:proton-coupled zinc antiporter SLC30A2 isoform X1 n=1 Tax=Sitodiplosis mosellana TaxID=263140 RepID=UPI002445167C|nr:proton-coupled zinc antiporter SLC30A2 isoform X1 [Sitodiplosis mosellana]